MRKKIAAANWKMNLSFQEAEQLLDAVITNVPTLTSTQEVVFGVPFPYLALAKAKTQTQQQIAIAAQNCAQFKNGAYTGETAASMLSSMSIDYVILGHSERRQYFNESDEILLEKVHRALENNLKIIFCVGEAIEVRQQNQHIEYVTKQLQATILKLSAEQFASIVIAYEPIWAIGTGLTANNQQINEMHLAIRNAIQQVYGNAIATQTSILYGGSVKANNAKEIFSLENVDGGLVGGASLIATDFLEIIKSI